MPNVMFLCPNMGVHTHEWFADDPEREDTHRVVTCLACGQARLINADGRVLGADEE
jgi:hypothetical protein